MSCWSEVEMVEMQSERVATLTHYKGAVHMLLGFKYGMHTACDFLYINFPHH